MSLRRQEPVAAVTPLRRPPVRQATIVRSDLAHTFETFARTIGRWWPLQPFSAGKERVRDVTIEERAGVRVYETWQDGTIAVWGEVLLWSLPRRIPVRGLQRRLEADPRSLRRSCAWPPARPA